MTIDEAIQVLERELDALRQARAIVQRVEQKSRGDALSAMAEQSDDQRWHDAVMNIMSDGNAYAPVDVAEGLRKRGLEVKPDTLNKFLLRHKTIQQIARGRYVLRLDSAPPEEIPF